MSVETSTTISGLNADWPLGSDKKNEGDNHMRLIKAVLKAVFDDEESGLMQLVAQNVRLGLIALARQAISLDDATGGERLILSTDATAAAANALLELFDSTNTSKQTVAVSAGGMTIKGAGAEVLQLVGAGGLSVELGDATGDRLRMSTDTAVATANAKIEALDNAHAVQKTITVTKDKMTFAGGTDAGDVLTTGNVVYVGADKNNLDFPIGTTLLWTSATGAADPGFENSGIIPTLRMSTGSQGYFPAGGTNTLLGTWRSRGYSIVQRSGSTCYMGLAQRTA